MFSGHRKALLCGSLLLSPILMSSLMSACSSSGDTPAAAGSSGTAGAAGTAGEQDAGDPDAPDVLTPPDINRTETEVTLEPKRKACGFKAGDWPAETLGKEIPVGKDIPINHVIVIIQENRSFDNYLGQLVNQGYYKPGDFSPGGTGFSQHDQIDGPPEGWSNLDSTGQVITPHKDTEFCYGVNHSWVAMHDDYNNGALDHFVTQNEPNGQRTFYYEDDTIIPFYYALADKFSVGDRYFASVMSSTWPNRLFAMAGTSFGIADNTFVTADTYEHPVTQIFSQLQNGNHTWMDYTDGPHQVAFFSYFGLDLASFDHYKNIRCKMLTDIQNGTLPDVSYVMGDEVGETSDEGPSALPGIGGKLVEQLMRALFASPSWKDTAVFITYDENGGMADHVPPAPACLPDDIAPHYGNNDNTPVVGQFDHTGFRVPFTVVSPYAKKHYASHTVYDHTSIVRFIEARFGLPAMTGRDANATPPMEMFDFENPPYLTPPDIAATTVVDPAVLTQCGQEYAPFGCDPN